MSEGEPRKIKVLNLITHFALGGATEVVLSIASNLNPDQFEAAILCGKTSANEQDLLDGAVSTGVQIHQLPTLRRPISPAVDLRAYRDLVAWLRRNPFDVVHTSGSKAGIIGRLAAAEAGVPVIVHTVFGWGHHDHMSVASRRFYISLERRAARVTDRIITVSDANRRKGLRDKIGAPSQYSVIYNAIDIERFRDVTVDRVALRRSLGITGDAPVVGTVSRAAPQKAPEDFLKVAREVHATRPDVRFVFVGGGPQEDAFRQSITRMGLDGVVLPLGYRNDVPELLRVFDVFLLTSLWEGLPLVIPQAMCADLPAVATAVDGTPEVVIEGETGFLADPHDIDTMARRCIQLLDDPKLRGTLGAAGRRLVDPAFCHLEMVRRTEDVYRECLESKGLWREGATPVGAGGRHATK